MVIAKTDSRNVAFKAAK